MMSILERSTVLEQRDVYAQLEPVWSGAMERAGQAPGLSAYDTRGYQVYAKRARGRVLAAEDVPVRKKSVLVHPSTPEQRSAIKGYLLAGWSQRKIAARVGVSPCVVRRCSDALKASGLA